MKITLTSLFFLTLTLTAQSSFAQFLFNGNAKEISTKARPHSFQLTSESKGEKGNMWHTSKINLTDQSWTIAFEAYFGKHENKGSDGMALVFQNDPRGIHTIGKAENGRHLGFYSIKPSLIVEFDTFDDGAAAGDISEDHISLIKNGSADAANQLTPPVAAKVNKSGIEDNLEHPVKVEWNADNQTISVYFDGILRQTYTGDIVEEIFAGNNEVYYGFTGSSNKSKNKHLIYNLAVTSEASTAAKTAVTLPVTLINFQGTVTGNETILTWATAMEKNSDYFQVERSSNGKNWTALTRITSRTNSNTRNDYSYTAAATGLAYYRLKMVDLDGATEYSKIISVRANALKASGVTCYPNPAQNGELVKIEFTATEASVILIISDLTGKVMLSKKINATGSQVFPFETMGLKTGMYVVQVISGAASETARIIIK